MGNILVTETGGNWSTASWYRAEAWQLDMRSTSIISTTTRYSVTTFANAGNIRGLISPILIDGPLIPTGNPQPSIWIALQQGRTATMSLASPTIVTLAGHGFAGAVSGVTISIDTPALISLSNHGLCNGNPVGFSTSGSLPTGIASTVTYYVINATTNTFNIALTRDGAAINTSGTQSGTHSLWRETVQFTTTGGFYTGIAANTVYFVDRIGVDTFYMRPSPTGTRINATGSQSGTHTCWTPRDYAYKKQTDIVGNLTYLYAVAFVLPFMFQKNAAIDTVANGWRFQFSIANLSTGTYRLFSPTSSSDPMVFIAWGATTLSYTAADTPILCARTIINQDVTFKQNAQVYPNNSAPAVIGFAGLICTPTDITKRGYSSSGDGNCMLGVNANAPYTITVDGAVLAGTQAGYYFGTEDSPISYNNKLTINYITQTIAGVGTNTFLSGFGDIIYGYAPAYGGVTMVKSGAYPAKRYATLISDAAINQPQLVVDDATGMQANDYVYISKSDILGAGSHTRYRISSIAENVITLTTNVIGEKRLAGGKVVLIERGYGIQEYGQTLSSYSNGTRLSSPTNYFINGVYQQGIVSVTSALSSASAALIIAFDDISRRRTAGFYIGNSLIENYQNAQNASCCIAGIIAPNIEGALLDGIISIAAIWASYIMRAVSSPVSGTILRSGDVEIRNSLILKNTRAPIGIGGNLSTTLYAHDNIFHNGTYGINLTGSDGKWDNNYLYGITNAIYASTCYFCNLSKNIYDQCGYIYKMSATGLVILGLTENAPLLQNGSPVNYAMDFSSDSYLDMLIFSPHGSYFSIDDINQNFISNNSEIKIISNNNSDGSIEVILINDILTTWTKAITLPIATLDTPGIITTAFEDTQIDFAVAGTYNLTSGAHLGTLTLSNSSGGTVIVLLSPTIAYANIGPNIAVNIYHQFIVSAPNIPTGASVRLINQSKNIELDMAINLSTSYSITLDAYSGSDIEFGDIILLAAFKAAGIVYSKYYSFLFVVPLAGDITIINSWETWPDANKLNMDGSMVEDFLTDFTNIQIDIKDGTATWWGAEAVAFSLYQTMTAEGMRNFFGMWSSQNPNRWTSNGIQIDNLSTTSANQTDTVILSRTDGSDIRVQPTTGGGGIGLVIANDITSLLQNLQVALTSDYDAAKNAASAIAVSAIPTNPLLATDDRLTHLDADISSRTVPGDAVILTDVYDAAKNAASQSSVNAIKAKTDTLPANPSAVGSAMTLTSAYDAAKVAASQASINAIPTNPLLATDDRLKHLDADISSATGGFSDTDRATLQETHDHIGTPAGDSVSADVAAVKSDTEALVNAVAALPIPPTLEDIDIVIQQDLAVMIP